MSGARVAPCHTTPNHHLSRPRLHECVVHFLPSQVPHMHLQERAYVTGLIAANLVVSRLGQGQQMAILDTEADEPHVAVGKDAIRTARQLLETAGLRSPFL